jgi:hypothetical protein
LNNINFDIANKALKNNAKVAMTEIALLLKKRAQKRTPVDTGFLRTSSQQRVETAGESFKSIVDYTADYAIAVHENLNARHPTGQAKFLRDALILDVKPKFEKILAKYIKF